MDYGSEALISKFFTIKKKKKKLRLAKRFSLNRRFAVDLICICNKLIREINDNSLLMYAVWTLAYSPAPLAGMKRKMICNR